MAATLEELEKRLAAVERELALLRQRLEQPPLDETPAERGARMIREAERAQPRVEAAWKKLMEELGIRGEPIGAEKLQQMMIAEGINPEDNEFSREIIKRREE